MNSNITNFFQVRVQVRVQKFLFFEFEFEFEFEFGQNCRVLRVRVRSPGYNNKKIKICTNLTKMVLHFYKNYSNMLVNQWFSKFKSYFFFSMFRYSHSPKIYDKKFFFNFFLLLSKKLFVFVIK